MLNYNNQLANGLDEIPARSEGPLPAVYILTHESTGMFYIGSTQDVRRRLRQHAVNLNRGVHPSARMQELHDHDISFEVEWLPTKDQEAALVLEQKFLDEYHSSPYCINRASDAKASGRGLEITPESREKMRQAKLGKSQTPEHIEKARQAKIGLVPTPEARRKISEALTGRTIGEEAKQKMREAKLGKTLSEETRLRMSLAQKGRQLPATQLEKQAVPVSIEGKKYGTMSEAAQALGLEPSVLRWRVNSTGERFKNWKKL